MLRFTILLALCIPALKAQEPPQSVVTTTVKEMCLNPCVKGVGTFTPYNDVILKAEIPGRIESVEFKEGDDTKENQLLFRLHSDEQQAKVKKAEAALELSKSMLKRKKAVHQKGFLSPQELESVQSQVKINEAELTLAKEELEKTRILAPFEGVLSNRQVSKGTYVIEGDELVRIQDVTPIRLTFDVPQKEIPFIKVGDNLTATTDMYPEKVFDGKVEAIEPSVNEKTRSVTVYATFPNKEELLIPGLYGSAQLKTSTNAQTSLYIPEQAIVVRPDDVYVYKKVDNKAVLTPVSLGKRLQDKAEVLSGLKNGDEIILEGQDKLHDGSPITATPSDKASSEKK